MTPRTFLLIIHTINPIGLQPINKDKAIPKKTIKTQENSDAVPKDYHPDYRQDELENNMNDAHNKMHNSGDKSVCYDNLEHQNIEPCIIARASTALGAADIQTIWLDLIYSIDKLNYLFRINKTELSEYFLLINLAPWHEFKHEAYDSERPFLWSLYMNIQIINPWPIQSNRKKIVESAKKLLEHCDISLLHTSSKDPLIRAKMTLADFENAYTKLNSLPKLSHKCQDFLYKIDQFISKFKTLLNTAESALSKVLQHNK